MKLLILLAALLLTTLPAYAQPLLQMCGNQRNTPTKTSLVDGDTLWLQGENIGCHDPERRRDAGGVRVDDCRFVHGDSPPILRDDRAKWEDGIVGYFAVTYDLNNEQDSDAYVGLWNALGRMDSVKAQRSVYYVHSQSTQAQVFSALNRLVGKDDYLTVVEFYARPSWNKALKGTKSWLDRQFG